MQRIRSILQPSELVTYNSNFLRTLIIKSDIAGKPAAWTEQLLRCPCLWSRLNENLCNDYVFFFEGWWESRSKVRVTVLPGKNRKLPVISAPVSMSAWKGGSCVAILCRSAFAFQLLMRVTPVHTCSTQPILRASEQRMLVSIRTTAIRSIFRSALESVGQPIRAALAFIGRQIFR